MISVHISILNSDVNRAPILNRGGRAGPRNENWNRNGAGSRILKGAENRSLKIDDFLRAIPFLALHKIAQDFIGNMQLAVRAKALPVHDIWSVHLL